MGRAENWRLINLTGDTHPIHVHLDAFQIISRQPAVVELPEGGITDTGTRATVRIGQPAGHGIQHGPDANELGYPRPPVDRKSTRLNSSHQIISYAVFCLKKKKKDKPLQSPSSARMTAFSH